MASYNASNADCTVYTYKDGLLSKIAHDLKIKATSFTVELNDDAVTLSLDPNGLRVECCMKNGVAAPGSLADRDKRKIESSIVKDVLQPKKYPTINFASSSLEPKDDGYLVKGTLKLHGRERTLSTHVRREGDRLVADVTLHQPDYGITPYKALMGTLKIKADVRVVLSIPAS